MPTPNPFEAIDNKLDFVLQQIANNKPEVKPKSRRGGIELAVEVTGYKKSYILKLTSSAEIPHRKRGKQLWFDEEELRDWQDQYKVKTTKEIEKEAIQNIQSFKRARP